MIGATKVDLYYASAENPRDLRKLIDHDITKVCISFFEWQRRHDTDDVYRHIPSDMKVCITPGVARKKVDDIDWREFGEDYVRFAQQNAEDCVVFDLDAMYCPQKVRRDVRNQLVMLPNVVVFPTEDETLEELARNFERLGVNARLSKSTQPADLRRIKATLYGSNVGNQQTLTVGHFAATTTMYWLSPQRFGELWIFSRNRMRHYAAANLTKAVKAHYSDIVAYGVDPDLCAANDTASLCDLALASFEQMAVSLSRRPRDREIASTSPKRAQNDSVAEEDGAPAISAEKGAVVPLEQRERIPLPTIRVDEGKVVAQHDSIRQCDGCYLNGVCPEYKEGSVCAFNISVEIKSKAQWESAVQSILEMQYGRIAFAQMAEQMVGEQLNSKVGQEMDRFMKILQTTKELADAPDPEAMGALSRHFPKAPEIGDGDDGNEEDASDEEGDEEDDGYGEDGGDAEQVVEAEYVDVGTAYEEEGAAQSS
jgi:hypothetical protein